MEVKLVFGWILSSSSNHSGQLLSHSFPDTSVLKQFDHMVPFYVFVNKLYTCTCSDWWMPVDCKISSREKSFKMLTLSLARLQKQRSSTRKSKTELHAVRGQTVKKSTLSSALNYLNCLTFVGVFSDDGLHLAMGHSTLGLINNPTDFVFYGSNLSLNSDD